jgi:membrane-associated phospholipid phosphatase
MTMETIWQVGIDFIQAIQVVHGPVLDAVFKAITFMGEEEFFLVLLPLIFWCVDPAAGARLVVVFLLSAYVNSGLKDVFRHPRPFDLDTTVKLHEVGGYGLPSGHSQSAVVVWGTVAVEFRKRWLWIVAVALMVLIGFSRIYLGVHFPTDVLAGWTVGAVVLALYVAWGPRIEAWLRRADLARQLAVAVVVPLALMLVHPTKDTTSSMAVLMGLGVGMALSQRIVPYATAGSPGQRALRFLVGVLGVLVLYLGLSLLFPSEGEPLYLVLRAVRYASLGLWAALGAPWLFLRLGLGPNELG